MAKQEEKTPKDRAGLGFGTHQVKLYGKFSRPQTHIRYSTHCLIAPYDEITGFMFRLANTTQNELIETEVRVTLTMNDLKINELIYTPVHTKYTLVHTKYTPIVIKYTPIAIKYTPIAIKYTFLHRKYTSMTKPVPINLKKPIKNGNTRGSKRLGTVLPRSP